MEDIKMNASKAPYAKLKPELDAAFSAVMNSMDFEGGPWVGQLTHALKAYLEVARAFPCAKGGAAFRMALRALQVKAGAEVILPAFGDAGLARIVLEEGLKPVFADVDAATFTLSPAAAARAVTEATAAVVPVHLFGQCAQMPELMPLAARYGLWVVEDASQALGAVVPDAVAGNRKAGGIGHIGIVSFFPSKPLLEEGEGGAVATSHPDLVERVQQVLQERGSTEAIPALPSLDAAMLEVKLKYVDTYNAARQKVAGYYDEAFAGTLVQVPHRAPYSTHVYQQYTITVPAALRDGLRQHLYENYIPSMVYYPQPLHLQAAFSSSLGYNPGDFPVAELLSQSTLSLPLHSELKEDQLAYICQHVLNYVKYRS
ncbi:DegT/DnrJ/EryC1/StrS family aminotransferase [Pontibacter actiniarum]|nr:DegT/DnrJ/EryC1/StrS family aminotransferase [Pontibacter actiniarum]